MIITLLLYQGMGKKVAYNCLQETKCKAYIFILVLQEINSVFVEKCILVTFHSLEGNSSIFLLKDSHFAQIQV